MGTYGGIPQERNQEATCYVGDLDPKVNEPLLWELFLQCGPVGNVHIPKDKLTLDHMGYGFVEFFDEQDADYAIKIMSMVKLFGRPIRVNKSTQNKRVLDVGANLFVGNLDPDVDEKLLYDTFNAFGGIIPSPKIMRDSETGVSRGFGFISYDNFESADAAIEAMNGQYLCNRPISVTYAFKKESKGERHGSQAERLIAAQAGRGRSRPHPVYAAAPPVPMGMGMPFPMASGVPGAGLVPGMMNMMGMPTPGMSGMFAPPPGIFMWSGQQPMGGVPPLQQQQQIHPPQPPYAGSQSAPPPPPPQ